MLQTSSFGSEDCLYLNIWVPHGQNGSFFVFLYIISRIIDTVEDVVAWKIKKNASLFHPKCHQISQS